LGDRNYFNITVIKIDPSVNGRMKNSGGVMASCGFFAMVIYNWKRYIRIYNERHCITKILVKVALNTIQQTL
jgi:hypothetical protein